MILQLPRPSPYSKQPEPPGHAAADAQRLAVTLPCQPFVVAGARAIVRNLLSGCPRALDAAQVAGELLANAIRYSLPPGAVTELVIDLRPGQLRIEVTETGSAEPAHALAPAVRGTDRLLDDSVAGDYTRGLAIVRQLAERRGLDRYPDHAVWWAELTWETQESTDG